MLTDGKHRIDNGSKCAWQGKSCNSHENKGKYEEKEYGQPNQCKDQPFLGDTHLLERKENALFLYVLVCPFKFTFIQFLLSAVRFF